MCTSIGRLGLRANTLAFNEITSYLLACSPVTTFETRLASRRTAGPIAMELAYQRHLPHRIPEGVPIFLTWNLKGALPKEVIELMVEERERLGQLPKRAGESSRDRKIREDKLIFAIADRALDAASDGPMFLKDPAAARIVEDSILFGVPDRYDLFAWCVMANHVHVLFTPHWKFPKVTQGIKGYTAHKINALQNARGRIFWQDESYDHWARDDKELLRIIAYIENNPVAASLCARPEDWPVSSARFRHNWPPGQPFQKK
jgi:putative transposase